MRMMHLLAFIVGAWFLAGLAVVVVRSAHEASEHGKSPIWTWAVSLVRVLVPWVT